MEKVHRISIIPRGRALGYTLNLPEEDRYLKTKEELMDYLVVLLGGRVTEHLVFGQITTGASDDLRKVHEISRSMVTEYGMGTAAAQSSSCRPTTTRCPTPPGGSIDEEQQFIADQAHRRALALVTEHRPLLEAFAGPLLEHEVLEREDIERLVKGYLADQATGGKSLPPPRARRRPTRGLRGDRPAAGLIRRQVSGLGSRPCRLCRPI